MLLSYFLFCVLWALAVEATATWFASCQVLTTLLPGRIFLPSTETYRNSVASYFAVQTRLQPECIFQPRNTVDVSVAVKALALDGRTKFAVRSGGHAPNLGFANTQAGVTFDLRSMSSVKLSADKTVAEIGAGAVWGQVYGLLDQFNLSVPGGRGSDIGVGGFITGGGVSAFGRRLGWGCDNVENFEVVIASGKIVSANARENSDLFQALKGGGNNLGVVTRIDLRTHAQIPFYAGSIFSSPEAVAQTIKIFTEFKTSPNQDPFEEVEQTYISDKGAYYTSNQLFYTAPGSSDSDLQRWKAIPSQIGSTLRVSNMSDFAREVQGYQAINQQVTYYGTMFMITPTILEKIHALWKTATEDTFNAVGMTAAMTWQSVPKSSDTTSPNSLGTALRRVNEQQVVNVLLSNYWARAEDSDKVIRRTANLIKEIELLTQAQSVYIPFKYANYANKDQAVIAGYGAETVRGLQKTSKKYDPRGVFQKQVAGGFKLF